MSATLAPGPDSAPADPITVVTDKDAIREAAERAAGRAATALVILQDAVSCSEQGKLLGDARRKRLSTAAQYLSARVPTALGERVGFLSESTPGLVRHLISLDDALLQRVKEALARVRAAAATLRAGNWRLAEPDDVTTLANVADESESARTALLEYRAAKDEFAVAHPYQLPGGGR